MTGSKASRRNRRQQQRIARAQAVARIEAGETFRSQKLSSWKRK